MKHLLIIIIFSVLTFNAFSTDNSFSEDDNSELSVGINRGIKVKSNTGAKNIRLNQSKKQVRFFKVNTTKTFEKVKNQNTLVFSIGNDKYQKKSGFGKLEECYSDVKLLKHLFIHCIKIDSNNIFINKDLTLDEFKKRIKTFLNIVQKNKTANVIFTYSGHGNEDGSLVFVDGGMLKPKELKALINSYKNDTILIIDACYSGNN
ncbi:MAG: caspase family protein, partial [Spirochaetota bacterium]|nr:caspase family protein [Spirochaetota bacterium]